MQDRFRQGGAPSKCAAKEVGDAGLRCISHRGDQLVRARDQSDKQLLIGLPLGFRLGQWSADEIHRASR